MALQHYFKNIENYCITATPAAQAFTTATAAGVLIQQQAPHLQLQYTAPVVRTTTAAIATTTPAAVQEQARQQQQQQQQHTYQQQLHHLTLQQQQQQQPQQLHHTTTTTPNNTTTATQQGSARTTATYVATPNPQGVITQQPQQQLLIHSQQRLKQLQLKQPTIHQQHNTSYHHHPYYQQHTTNNNNNSHSNNNKNSNNTNSVINTIVITGAANHKFKSAQHNHHQQLQQLQQQQQQQTNYSHNRTLPIHAALNQNSNFSAVSSSTGGGTASSHAPTQQSNATNSSRSSTVGRTNAHNATDSAKQQGGAQIRSSTAGDNSNTISAIATNSKKIRTEPILSQYHQTERLTFANAHLVWGEEHWRRVVFQDERKFNLDGPDGFSNYFHDLRNYEQTLSQRPRGNSVYIYILLTVGGPIHLEVSTAKQRSPTYIATILRERANIIAKLGGNSDFILQDHNLTANMLPPNTQELLEAEGIKLQRWPTIAHDLNIMENIWGWLVREVYDGGRKFARKDDLIFRIRSAWTRLPMDFVVNLYSTLPERIAELYYTRGIYTNC